MTRKHIATFAFLAAAALPAPAFRVGVTADHLKAEINDRPVAVAIVHGCTDGEGYTGEGYTGEAKLACGGMKGRPVGFETEKDREAVFEDVARPFPLQPGTHAFEGEAVALAYTANALNQYTSRTVPGNVSEYVSTNGTIVAHYDYSPFGETLIASGDLASSFTHRFSTKPWCSVTGLYEYQMRKYRPEIGRWLSRDPIGENERKLGLHQYCFHSV